MHMPTDMLYQLVGEIFEYTQAHTLDIQKENAFKGKTELKFTI